MSKALVRLTVNTSEGDEIKLEVGDHSPIWVIKEELQRESGRPVADQVLCLLNDKGDEGELLEDDRATIYECGIRSGSTLFLSFLASAPVAASPRVRTPATAAATVEADAADGEVLNTADAAAAAERARSECRAWCSGLRSSRQAQREEVQREEERERYGMTNPAAPASIMPSHPPIACVLTTDKAPREAEHSFNGVMFDIEAKEPFEISVHSVHVGGMLGTMSVFACSESWCSDERSLHQYSGYGRQEYAISEHSWERVYHSAHKPMWDSTTEIKFDKPIVLLPGTRRGIYVHSALPDDLGLQYQSTRHGAEIADQDAHIRIIPGVGHTSSIPFDRDNGWYRYPRSLAGRLGYEATVRTWAPRYHKQFPDPLKLAVKTMMLAQKRKGSILSLLPVELVYHVMENCEWDAFGSSARPASSSDEEEDERPGSMMRRMMGGGARGGGRHRYGGGGRGGGGQMVLLEFDGRHIPVPMTDLLQMMGGDAGALQSLLGEGNVDSSDDDESSDDNFDGDSIDSDPDEEPAPVLDEEAIDEKSEDSDSDQSFQDAAAAAPCVAIGGPAAAAEVAEDPELMTPDAAAEAEADAIAQQDGAQPQMQAETGRRDRDGA